MKAFGNYHPFVLLVYFLSVLLVAMFVSNPVLQTEALLGGIIHVFNRKLKFLCEIPDGKLCI